MYPYTSLSDGTEAKYTPIFNINGEEIVEVHFARPREGGFDTAICKLPSYKWVRGTGFSDSEINDFEKMLRKDEHEIFEHARDEDESYV